MTRTFEYIAGASAHVIRVTALGLLDISHRFKSECQLAVFQRFDLQATRTPRDLLLADLVL